MGFTRSNRERQTILLAVIFIAILLILVAAQRQVFDASPVYAAQTTDGTPTPTPTPTQIPYPQKYRTLYSNRTEVYHEWMLLSAEENITCYIYMVTLDKPTDKDILGFCGYYIYQLWLIQQDCVGTGGDCTDLRLYYIDPIEEQLRVSIYLPGPLAHVETVNCPAWGECDQYPLLSFSGFEPINTESIVSAHIEFVDLDIEIECENIPCVIDIPLTQEDGTEVNFYVTSSYGDKSQRQTFKVRNIALSEGKYLVELLGPAWWSQVPAELKYWEFFPPLSTDNLTWAADVSTAAELATNHDYTLLAGNLILRGSVSAANCADGGLLSNGAASPCGMEAARVQTQLIQNSFDQYLLDAARIANIPPKILKGVIGQESQFWHSWVIEGEYGYGMMTDKGVDMLLTYDTRFFLDLCTPVYGLADCAWGYSNLGEFPRAYLRGLALSTYIGTDQEFELVARTIAAATGQAGQIVRNVTKKEPGDVVSYKEMWLISLAIYHGGGGCVGVAAQEANDNLMPLTWANISEFLVGDCQYIATYPYLVLRYAEPQQ